MQIVEKGLILRETPYKEADVMLCILTECSGKLSVVARGAKRKGSKVSAAIQLFTYSEFTLYESGGRYTLNEAEPVEMFFGIRNDIVKLSLASYFAEVLEQASDEDSINPELLRLGLNALFALSKTDIPKEKIKAVFELRAAELSGYAPTLSDCIFCDCKSELKYFDIKNGGVVCEKCNVGGNIAVDASVIDAMKYIVSADVKRIFSFSINDDSMKNLAKISNEYLRFHFDRNFKTDAFYKGLL